VLIVAGAILAVVVVTILALVAFTGPGAPGASGAGSSSLPAPLEDALRQLGDSVQP
jgi:hypothetical protein